MVCFYPPSPLQTLLNPVSQGSVGGWSGSICSRLEIFFVLLQLATTEILLGREFFNFKSTKSNEPYSSVKYLGNCFCMQEFHFSNAFLVIRIYDLNKCDLPLKKHSLNVGFLFRYFQLVSFLFHEAF